MKPPYELTQRIIRSVASVSHKIGQVDAKYLSRPHPKLRKQNRIKTIHSSLKIEGNTLTEVQMTAIIENRRVAGPERDIKEVINAIKVYENLTTFNFKSEKDFLKAHQRMMSGLIRDAGKYRSQGVGIVKGSDVQHVAPPHQNVRYLMSDLFDYLRDPTEFSIIKSCVFHYEMEFIHPFTDGNGRMGRLWQTLILMSEFPVFEFLPFETIIADRQAAYYKALSASDKQGKSTKFIEFMLTMIEQSLDELLETRERKLDETERLELFLEQVKGEFTRSDYIRIFSVSTATASRDLRNGVERGLIRKSGDKKTTRYRAIKKKKVVPKG